MMRPGLHALKVALATSHAGLEFRPLRGGVDAAWIYGEHGSDGAAAFLRYAPGATIPAHRHEGYEHILVIEGSQEDERGSYESGTLITNEPGSEHRVQSRNGCLVLVIWQKRVTFLHDAVG